MSWVNSNEPVSMKRVTRRVGNLLLKSGAWLQRRSALRIVNRADAFISGRDGAENGDECFIGFFGLNRSLDITSDSISACVVEPLNRFGFHSVSGAHLNSPAIINSPRSGERDIVVDSFGVQNLDCELIWREPQRERCIEPLASDIFANYPMAGEADDDRTIRRNAMLQMYSQVKLLGMLRMIGMARFKVFCFARPDLLFIDAIPHAAIRSVADGSVDVVTPSWQRWGGLNDRFALCSLRGAEIYLDRLNWVSSFCQEKGYFHPEEILLHSIEKSGLTYDFMPTRARRVRSTGSIKYEDFSI
jgi:hypothetical protein